MLGACRQQAWLNVWYRINCRCVCARTILEGRTTLLASPQRDLVLRAIPSRISKHKLKQVCTSHTDCVTNLWYLWRSQSVTNLNLWPNLCACFFLVFLAKQVWSRGWSLKGQERKANDTWTARQVHHNLTSRFCCYRCSTLFNYNRYSCTGAFLDLIEWLKDYFLDLYLSWIFWMSTMSRFWICWGW